MIDSQVLRNLKAICNRNQKPAVQVRPGGIALFHTRFVLIELPLVELASQLDQIDGSPAPELVPEYDWRVQLADERGESARVEATSEDEWIRLRSNSFSCEIQRPCYDLVMNVCVRPDFRLTADRTPGVPAPVNVYDGKKLIGVIMPRERLKS